MNKSQVLPLKQLFLLVLVAFATSLFSKLAFLVGILVFGLGIFHTVQNRNSNGEAHLYAGFILGAEVYFRMNFAGLPWAFSQYSISLLLLTGLLLENKPRPKQLSILAIPILFLPSILFSDFHDFSSYRKELTFNISGYLPLFFASIYFYRRKFSKIDYARLSKFIIYGVFIMATLILIKTPSYSAIAYGGGANFTASGGFGPNQVTATLSLGIIILSIGFLMGHTITSSTKLDVLLFSLFAIQGFFTFSRGGLIAVGIALIIAIAFHYLFFFKKSKASLSIPLKKLILIFALISFVFVIANIVSDGALSKRYFNVDEHGQKIKEDYTTHRGSIAESDLNTFKNNWSTGVGIGGSREGRILASGIGAVHVEFSRLLADHGILGVFILVIIVMVPIKVFLQSSSPYNRLILVCLVTFAILTTMHNAMRLSIAGFCYGLAFINLITEKNDFVYRK